MRDRRTSPTSAASSATTGSTGRRGRLARAVVLGGVALLGLLAVALAGGSFASYASVKEHLDSLASDGDADVTRADYDAIVLRLRLAAAAAATAAFGAYAARRRLRGSLSELGISAVTGMSELRRSLAGAITHESRVHLGAIALITLVALLVRLEFLFQPMRYDESVTYVHYASQPWYIALTTYTAPNNHVFHSLLVHLSTALFGGEPWAIRLPAFMAGVLLVPATYVAARALYGKHAALVAAGLVACSSVIVEYSTNARGYSLVALLFVTLLALATRLRTSASPAEWLAFSALAAIGFFTVPVMLYAFGTVLLWLAVSLLASGDRVLLLRRLLPAVAATCVLSALFYAPIAAASGVGSLVSNEFVEPRSWSAFTADLPDSLVSVVEGWHRDIPWPLAVMLGAGFVVALVFHARIARVPLPPALAALAFIAPVVVAQRVVPFDRVWLFLLPLYLLTAAAGLVYLLRPLATRVGGEGAPAIVLALLLAGSLAGNALATRSVYDSEDTSTFRDGGPVADLLATELRPGDKLVVAPPADAILEYHLLRRGLDPAALLFWDEPGRTTRFLVVVKVGADDYSLAEVLGDPRLRETRLGEPRLLRRYDAANVYELARAG